MRSLDAMNLQVGAYLYEVRFERWSKTHFSGHRYNIMTTNIVESVNALIGHARGLPITMLVKFIRDECLNFVNLWIEEKISRRLSKSARLKVRPITPTRYQVVGFGGYIDIMDFNEMSCTCRKFQLSCISCKYAIAIARHMRLTNVNA
ncbi:uncharacterized protein LOC123215368 [Mangifera indica]|uniref:uncharacterized protein LOC123215368 n=1 Tax=Mangifera indica TaxID=29780 RepID=UPI001CFBEB76|nr:uncharacterized protein LOC123215368 [Mangifera indica]